MSHTTVWRRFLGNPTARAGLVVGAGLATVALVGPLVVSTDPAATDYGDRLTPPSGQHWLGTDDAGRDVLSRTVDGTRRSLSAAAVVSLLTVTVGVTVGGLAGYVRGPVDAALSRFIDVLMGLPDVIIALAIVGAFGVGHENLVLALALTGWAPLARVARSLVLGSRERPDVVAARLAGVGPFRAFVTHVAPGMLGQVLVVAATGFGTAVLALASLSFLGLGAQPPTAELGRMLSDSQGDLADAPWLGLAPGLVVAATVAAAMLLSDALRDVLDPAGVVPARSPSGRRGRRRAPWAERRWQGRGERRYRPGPGPAEASGPGRRDRDRPAVPAHESPPLVVQGLSVTYAGGARALSDVELTVEAGECLALVGESGCGKTTLGHAVLRLLPASAGVDGDVRVAGEAVADLAGPDLRRLRGQAVGYVGQDPFAACDPLRSVGSHVRDAWRAHRVVPPDDVAERVAALGIDGAARRLRERPHQWSGGMLQRATIAAAVAHDPPVIVADEPTSALDAALADDVLATLARASRALLLISHDLGLVQNHAHRVAVMYAGRIVEVGATADVIDRPRHPYTRALLDASPRGRVRSPGARERSAGAVTNAAGGPDGSLAPGAWVDRVPEVDRAGVPVLSGSDRKGGAAGIGPTRGRYPAGGDADGPADAGGCAYAARCPWAEPRCTDERPGLVDGVACWLVGVS